MVQDKSAGVVALYQHKGGERPSSGFGGGSGAMQSHEFLGRGVAFPLAVTPERRAFYRSGGKSLIPEGGELQGRTRSQDGGRVGQRRAASIPSKAMMPKGMKSEL